MKSEYIIHKLALQLMLLIFACISCYAAGNDKAQPVKKRGNSSWDGSLFKTMPVEQTGIDFLNLTPGAPAMKKESRMFTIASGGIAFGDVNGDGLIDVYMTCFTGANKLFINQGNFQFKEDGLRAGVRDSAGFGFGAAMVDIDGDGDLDIYLTKYNFEKNKLFINDGKGNFSDKAGEYGLDIAANGIQSTFFDYDLDGDIDILIINNGIEKAGYKHTGVTPMLMQNQGNGKFVNVSQPSGIDHRAFGLSATAADINNDGWPDVYIANDFEEKDYLYINQRNGTFRRQSRDSIPHTVMFGMGNDVADMNNDGLLDIITVDMLPELHERLNTQFDNFSTYSTTFDSSQFVQNVLQLNRGNGRFSDIAQMAGVHATEWSWSVFFADLDNDGRKDLFVANGLKWDFMDKDFTRFGITHDEMRKIGINAAKGALDSLDSKTDMRQLAENFDITQLLRKVKRTQTPNYLFKNNGDLTFTKVTEQWGMEIPYNTCSAGYADLDNDGDVDLIINTIDSTAVVYKNMSSEMSGRNWLTVRCRGLHGNTHGLGARITVKSGGEEQTSEITITRGFASGMAAEAYFGLGNARMIEEIRIQWPGMKQEQIITKVKPNQILTFYQKDSRPIISRESKRNVYLESLRRDSTGGIDYLHQENEYDDFFNERLLPNKLSINGPGMASGDIDGNGLDDIIIGGAQGYPISIFLQQQGGEYKKAIVQKIFQDDSIYEDQSLLIFDADSDGDLDIYAASGGNEDCQENASLLQDRLYLNDGKGLFSRGYLPLMPVSKSCVVGGDFDNDGDIDLFVGGRNIPGKYDQTPRSYLLLNTQGNFTDVTEVLAYPLLQCGLITSALWTDYDLDGDLDLLICGEWLHPRILQNNQGTFSDRSKESGLSELTGWWNSVIGGDFDNDGDIDYALGNIGLNTRYKASGSHPMELYSADFDENGSMDYIVGYYEQEKLYPARITNSIISQMPNLRKRFINFADIARATLSEVVGGDSILSKASHRSAGYQESYFLKNKGNGSFEPIPLPKIAQTAPVYGQCVEDIDGDGNLDLIQVGNFYGPDREMWRFDAGIGMVLLGDGRGGFRGSSVTESGFYVPDESRSLVLIADSSSHSVSIHVSNNKGYIQSFRRIYPPSTRIFRISPSQKSTHALITYKNGKSRRQEFYCGSGYYSQQPPFLILTKDVVNVKFFHNKQLITNLKF